LLRPRAWLNNFSEPDSLTAAVLLDQFVYYSDRLTDHIFRAAMAPLVQHFGARDKGIALTWSAVETFLASAMFTPVEGETPNPTDSGPLMCRKLRGVFRIPDSRITLPSLAVEHALAGGAVILVDDFIGSGEQILTHWRRPYITATGQSSLADAYRHRPFPAFYVCLAATSRGLARIHGAALPVHICTAHELSDAYDIRNIANRNILSWFPSIKQDVAALLSAWAPRLSLPSYMRQQDFAEYGFHSYGLTIGFEHSPCPDATLPIFWAGTNDRAHVPLVVRPQ
jgi:hypothetical protein